MAAGIERGGAHVRPEPGAARRARAGDRQRSRGLTILVNFQDVTSTVTRADVDDMLNGGQLHAQRQHLLGARVLPTRLERQARLHQRRRRALHAEPQPAVLRQQPAGRGGAASSPSPTGSNLTQFDSRDEGIVDALNVLYAGQTPVPRRAVAAQLTTSTCSSGTMRTDLYLLTSLGRTAADLSIGTFCHENGHLLCRFPDMYDYGAARRRQRRRAPASACTA